MIPSLNTTDLTFQALIPKDQYKGPILKLTKKEKEQISKYEHQIGGLELELNKLGEFVAKARHNAAVGDYYSDIMGKIETQIRYLKELIKEIKINRLNKQKSNKFDTTA